MRTLLTYLLLASSAWVLPENASAQNGAAINTSGTAADPSAILDISSDNSGLLIPRMTEANKLLIQSPATGLMIYQTDGISGLWFFDGTSWVQGAGTQGPAGATGATGATGASGFLPSGQSAGNTPYWDGSQWVINSSNIFNNGGTIGIGTTNPDASAAIEIYSTTKGTLITRMTLNERNAIQNPANGLQIYNTTIGCFEFYNGSTWKILSCGCDLPAVPAALGHTSTEHSITWNWAIAANSEGYRYNTINDYSTSTDIGLNTAYVQTGLICNTNYDLYVWSYNSCGKAQPVQFSYSTAACYNCGTETVTFTYRGSQVTYGTVQGQNNTCWLDRNLGASAVATSHTHSAAYGHLFQWGRPDDGHQIRTSGTTSALSGNDVPGHSNFITTSAGNFDWRNPQNDALWQGLTGTNNPCPAGWRIPVLTEFSDEYASWSQQNMYGAYASSLKFTSGGGRYQNGSVSNTEGHGHYWSSTINATNATYLYFAAGSVSTPTYYRGVGWSVRCIRD